MDLSLKTLLKKVRTKIGITEEKINRKEKMENYKLGEVIGIGGNSKIYKVTDKKGEKYAMKIIKKDKNGRYKNEIFFHSNLENKNIIRLYDSFENQDKVFILLELCGDNLYNYKKERKLEEKEIISIFSQIVNAIYYLHRNNIVHRDIKPENIGIDENINLILFDYG